MKEVAIGIDIGGTNTQLGFVEKNGNILVQKVFSTREENKTFEIYFDSLCMNINELRVKLGDNVKIIGIGIGAPNGNYYNGTIEFAPNLPWKGVLHLVEKCNNYFPFPSVLTNDAKAAAIGEMIYGAAKGMKDFIVITLGTGLGSGIVANGKLVMGHDGFAGEMGHTITVVNGRQCGCGLKGCLETYVSATGIKRTVYELLATYNQPSELCSVAFEELNAKQIADAAHRGDKIALEAFDFTGKLLGRKIAEAIAYFSPEAVFLFGGLALAGELIFEPTREGIEENILNIFKNKTKLLPSGIPESGAAVLGASALAWKEFA